MDEQHQNQQNQQPTAGVAGSQLDTAFLKLSQKSTEAPIVNRNNDKIFSLKFEHRLRRKTHAFRKV